MNAAQAALLAVVLLAALAALLLWALARAGRRRSGLPHGEIVYGDTGEWMAAESLFAPRYRLTGKPDYLVRNADGLVPVEVKPGRRAAEPYQADILQLAAYCLLVQEARGQRPPYGLLRYEGRTFRIPYDAALESALLRTLDDMRAAAQSSDVPRSHADPVRCRYCGLREDCHQSLVDERA